MAHSVALSWGWPRRLLAVAFGAIGALSMSPFGFLPALAVSLTGAVWLLDGSAARSRWAAFRQAAILGWLFGFGFFLAGLWWLGAAFLVEADKFAILMPLGVVGLPAGLAFFHALAFGFARLAWSRTSSRALVLAGALSLADFARGHVLTGFPWNTYGMAFGHHLVTAQAAAFLGLYGLGLVALVIAASPASLVDREGARWRLPAVAMIAFSGLVAFGAWRLASEETRFVPDVRLRIMQPNLPQDAKFRPENRDAIMRHYLQLSDRATSPDRSGVSDVTHLIWPESAFPFLLDRDPAALAQIAALLPSGVTLVTGAARAAPSLPGETALRFRNAIQVVRDDGTVTASYDKVHLVPFGEYLPFSHLLRQVGLRQFVAIVGGFEPGNRRMLLSVPGLPPVSPLICYEAIFPGAVTVSGEDRPGLLLNVTNDAWFGMTPGPYQHLAQARLRTIEEGVPMVRAANSGISAVIDPLGRVVAQTALGREAVLDVGLPAASDETFYARYRSLLFGLLILFLAGFAVWSRLSARSGLVSGGSGRVGSE